MKSALILGRSNGVGLDRDAALVERALMMQGVRGSAPAPRNLLQRLALGLGGGGRADIAIHLERAWPLWKGAAGVHFLIPNQERYPRRQIRRLRHIDHVLCKSHHAEQVFREFHRSVHYVGFTSPDRIEPSITPDYTRVFHLAGRSSLKNTALILALWERNPHWPLLTLVAHGDHAPRTVPPNVMLIAEYLSDHELRLLQNACGVHLCPSLAEGWGHYIPEAMSARALVLTTGAPPMNEIVAPDRGVLVPVVRSEPRHLGTMYHVDPDAFAAAFEGVLSMPLAARENIGARARSWFLANDARFTREFVPLLQHLARG